jgi:hypothetical protein
MSAARTGPLTVSRAVDHPVYAVAGGNHVTLLLHRDDAGCLLDVIEVLAQVVGQPGAMTGYFRKAGVLVPDEHTPPDHQPAGPAQLREIAARWGPTPCRPPAAPARRPAAERPF